MELKDFSAVDWDGIAKALDKTFVPMPVFRAMLKDSGSLRRLLEAYWLRRLSVEEERVIEDNVRPETLIGYKPCIR